MTTEDAPITPLRQATVEFVVWALHSDAARHLVDMPDDGPPDIVVYGVERVLHRWMNGGQHAQLPRFLAVATDRDTTPWYATYQRSHREQRAMLDKHAIPHYPVKLGHLIGSELSEEALDYLSCAGAGRAAWGHGPEEPAANQRPQRAVR